MRKEADPCAAVREYAANIRKQFVCPFPQQPSFDLILLGLGDDGHTASLFPNSAALSEHVNLIVANTSPRGIRDRITLTSPAINHARTIVFLVSGSSKASAVKEVLLDTDHDHLRWPAKMIRLSAGRLTNQSLV